MLRILLIDSDPGFLPEQLREIFAPLNVQVDAARTGQDGLNSINGKIPDLILLNVTLEDISGLEVYQQLRQLNGRARVIFINSSSTKQSAIEAMRQGAAEHRDGPLDAAQLEKVVSDGLNHGRGMREASPDEAPSAAAAMAASAQTQFDFDAYIRARLDAGTSDLHGEVHLQLDRILLPAALRFVNGNQLHAARILGIARQTLRNRLRELGLTIHRSIEKSQECESESVR